MTPDTIGPAAHDAAIILRLTRENEVLRRTLEARVCEIVEVHTHLDSLSIEWHDPMTSAAPNAAEKALILADLIRAFPLKLTDKAHVLPLMRAWRVTTAHAVDLVVADWRETVAEWVLANCPRGEASLGAVIEEATDVNWVYWLR